MIRIMDEHKTLKIGDLVQHVTNSDRGLGLIVDRGSLISKEDDIEFVVHWSDWRHRARESVTPGYFLQKVDSGY